MPTSIASLGRRDPSAGAPSMRLRMVALDLDPAELERASKLLNAQERDHAARGDIVTCRRRIALRAGLRALVGEAMHTIPAAVPLVRGRHGRPEVVSQNGDSQLDVSCSRSADFGLVAVASGHRLGVDLERVGPWHDDILEQGWLSDRERRALAALDVPARAAAATRCWTRKEALLKGRGTGLIAGMSRIETQSGVCRVGEWTIRDVRGIPHGYVASVATSQLPPHRRSGPGAPAPRERQKP